MTDHADVVILGASGMLGAMVLDVFASAGQFRIVATVRSESILGKFRQLYPVAEWRVLDAEQATEDEIERSIAGASWVINCIGVIKPFIHDDNGAEIERAVRVNALFPQVLARVAARQGARVIQIATDCVYSGAKGMYREGDLHDALDVYGKTKSLGEAHHVNVHSLRCSIIGPEPKGFVSLLEWFLGQPSNSQVNGFTNHQWNGVTTYHFGRICHGIVTSNPSLSHMQHVVPSGTVSKAEMLCCFAQAYDRHDIVINSVEAKTVIDRTLATEHQEINAALWKFAGFDTPPTVPQMIAEMGQLSCRWLEGRR